MEENPTAGHESSSQTCRDARGEQTPAGTQAKDFADAFDDETCMDSRPHKRRAAEKCDELAPPHGGAYPKARSTQEYNRTGVGRWGASQQKRSPHVHFGSFSSDRNAPDALGIYALPGKRTNSRSLDLSALCHFRTHAVQQNLLTMFQRRLSCVGQIGGHRFLRSVDNPWVAGS